MSIDYDLARELKDAGFPYKDVPRFWIYSEGMLLPDWKRLHLPSDTEVPTLEELIEACGLGLFELHRDLDVNGKPRWAAVADNDLSQYEHVLAEYGASPTEAVAHLWLALNKK